MPDRIADHDLLDKLLDALARRVARVLADELGEQEWIDQSASPLGSKRHAAAIRSGELPGRKVGRRWLARRSDVEVFMTGADNTAPRSRVRKTTKRAEPAREENVEELADRLGIAIGGRR